MSQSNDHTGNVLPEIAKEEHEGSLNPPTKRVLVYGYDGSAKQIAKVDSDGHFQTDVLTGGGSATIALFPYSYYQQASLVSGYTFHGNAAVGTNPTSALFRIQRETLNTGEVLFGSGTPQFIHTWSAASLASITYL